MRMANVAAWGVVLVFAGYSAQSEMAWQASGPAAPVAAAGTVAPATVPPASPYVHAAPSPTEAYTAVVQRVCVVCHNDRALTGNLSLAAVDVGRPEATAEIAEKMIRKLRAGMMPPPGMPRPGGDTLTLIAEELERRLDAAAAVHPDPGVRTFQRLNRAEYERSIRELLGLEINAGDYLPLDTKSANFDNIADVQMLSPTLLEAYLKAASDISRLAVGDPHVSPSEATYPVSRWESQTDRVEGAPYGTRGGISVVHTFPADGSYAFRVSFHHETTGGLVGNGRSALLTADVPEQLEIAIDGERAALLTLDRWMHVSDPNGVTLRTDPVVVRAGSHRVSAAFLRRAEGPVQDLVSPHDWSLASTAIAGTYGILSLPHLRDLVIGGPYNPTGVSETASRRRIFTCRPASPAGQRPCAQAILSDLGERAYRRPLTPENLADLMSFFDMGAAEGGFESGVRMALEAILASPRFVFRLETTPANARPGQSYRLSDLDLASRLSFFLWAGPPDQELIGLARRNELSESAVLERQARRMLADPRAEALGPRFAGQWLRLQDLDKIHPDVRGYPDFDDQLKASMRRETELFFNSLVREDRSVLELFTADYTFVNGRLARHYGIPGVTGDHFQQVAYPDASRRGLLGQGSILTLTSHANRTSPVLRGKWVMEVLIGTPPPPPPPGVPDLEETAEAKEGRLLTTRERMEMHRANVVCRSCHQFMDPIGLALDNFDVTGKWRIKENGVMLDTQGEMYDGTPVQNPADLRNALLKRPTPLIRTFTGNLMAYALGRRVEYYDMPAVRAIVRQAEANDYRISSFILGVVRSDAFQMKRVVNTVEDGAGTP